MKRLLSLRSLSCLVFSQYMFPIGTIIPYAGDLSKIPLGWHLCDGTNGTPDLSDRFLEGTKANPKTFKDAGLPDIRGHFSVDDAINNEGSVNGAFRQASYGSSISVDADNFNGGIDFAASFYNSIYGKSSTVQPKSYTVYYIMRIR